MGVVALVHDHVRRQKLALKRMLRFSERDVRRFKREFRAIEQLHHPNIVSVYELGVDDQGLYLLMEAVEGRDVWTWCRGPSAPSRRSADASEVRSSRTGAPLLVTPPGAEWSSEDFSAMTERLARAATEQGYDRTTLTLSGLDPSATANDGERERYAPLDDEGIRRLYDVIPQLFSALSYLHDRGLVHRDLKPANVLVTAEGTLKLLDFGILGEAGSAPVGALQGTVAYLAPEQIRGEAPAPSNDLYSLGVLLYEVVTGHLPFVGASRCDVLWQHLGAHPLRPTSFAPSCPAWLDDAIMGLLEKESSARLTLPALRRSAEPHLPAGKVSQVAAAPASVELVERKEEKRLLLEAIDESSNGAFMLVAISGPSGAGKSALLEWVSPVVRRSGLCLFRSRARFSERLPFNAIDGWVDDLAAYLESAPGVRADVIGAHLSLARTTFSSLVPLPANGALPPVDRVDTTQVFDAFIALIEECARIAGGVVLLCDDLQWGDADSVAFLQRLVLRRPRQVLLIGAVRDDARSEAFERWWPGIRADLHIEPAPLTEVGLARIIMQVVADAGRSVEPSVAERAASACDGRPFLAVVSGRLLGKETKTAEARVDPVAALVQDFAAKESLERRMLSLLAAIDGEASIKTFAHITGSAPGLLEDAFAPLVRERLVHLVGGFGEERTYDFSHDLVRRHVVDVLDPREMESAHQAVAAELERTGARAVELVRHLVASRQLERAAEVAAVAAGEALAANALGLAAELYGVAIAHASRDTTELRQARARTLERFGRYLDASRDWGELAERLRGPARIDALLNQAKALLATHHVSEGRRTLELARREHRDVKRVPELIAGPIAFARFKLGPLTLRTPKGRVVRPSSVNSDRDGVLAAMLGNFHPLASIRELIRAREGYLKHGIWVHAAEVEYTLAYFAYFGQPRYGATALAERYIKSAVSMYGRRPGPADGRTYAIDCFMRAVGFEHHGRWQEAFRAFDDTINAYEAAGYKGSYEYQSPMLHRVLVARHHQHVPTFERKIHELRPVVLACQDSGLRCYLDGNEALLRLVQGDPREAREIAKGACDHWPSEEPSLQRFISEMRMLSPEAYLGDGVEAHRRMRAALRIHARSWPMRNMIAGDVLSHAAIFEAMALHARSPDASYERLQKLASAAERATPLGRHMAVRAAAYGADYMGKPDAAIALLVRAEQLATRVDQPIDIAVARYQRGIRLGGAEGAELVSNARAMMQAAGAHPLLLEEDVARR
jgi:serine/threonine protein kinase